MAIKRFFILTIIAVSAMMLSYCSSPNTREDLSEEDNKSGYYDPNSYNRSSTVDLQTQSNMSSDGYTYWYIYCQTGPDMERFFIARFDHPYFSLVEAKQRIRERWSAVKEDDYIGITFYAQVTKECYDEYYAEE